MYLGLTWFGFVLRITFLAGIDVHEHGMMHFLHQGALQPIRQRGSQHIMVVLGAMATEGKRGASRFDNEEVVGILLNADVDLNAQDGEGGNALQAASIMGHEKIVEMLLNAGADVTAQGGENGNALQALSWKGNESVVKMLLHAGADVTAQDGRHDNALRVALAGGHERMELVLLEDGFRMCSCRRSFLLCARSQSAAQQT
jgi:hypothetical protein